MSIGFVSGKFFNFIQGYLLKGLIATNKIIHRPPNRANALEEKNSLSLLTFLHFYY